MINLWRYLFGFLTIKINSENSEKILNTAAQNKITIWNLVYKNGAIIGNVSIKNFYKLRYIKRGIKCKIHILKKSGILFNIVKYNKRFGFMVGIAIFFCTLVFLSKFIWIINIEGNASLSNAQILNSCKKIGVYEGVAIKNINSKYDSQKLQLAQSGIAWCSFNIEGSVLTINISETTISDKDERKTLSNIKANFTGKIKKIDVTSGKTLVKVGDFVSRGDLLVSGIVDNVSRVNFVHSEGTIIAETKREFSAQGDFTETSYEETGEILNRYIIEFFNIKFPLYLGNVKNTHNYDCNAKNLSLFDKKIPIKIAHERYHMTDKMCIQYDPSRLEEKLYKKIENQVKNFNFITATEEQKEVINTEKGILLKIRYVCEENIALQDKIILDS